MTKLQAKNALLYLNSAALLSGIKLYAGEIRVDTPTLATRLQYPMSNISLDSKIAFTCAVEKCDIGDDIFYDIGSATITLNNLFILLIMCILKINFDLLAPPLTIVKILWVTMCVRIYIWKIYL